MCANMSRLKINISLYLLLLLSYSRANGDEKELNNDRHAILSENGKVKINENNKSNTLKC